MSEETRNLQGSSQYSDNRGLVTVVVVTLIAEGMRGINCFPVGLLLVYVIVFLISYWIGRRPPIPFGRFTLRLVSNLLIVLAGLWAIPELLNKWVWTPLAYALPALGVAIWCYWVPPLYPSQRKRARLWVWLLFSIVLAVLYGWAMKFVG